MCLHESASNIDVADQDPNRKLATWFEDRWNDKFAVGVYLRETRRRNRDGLTVSYLQLAHNERHPETGAPTAKVIHGGKAHGRGG